MTNKATITHTPINPKFETVINLPLTPEEAVFVLGLVGSHVIGSGKLRDYTSSIYNKLIDVVPCVNLTAGDDRPTLRFSGYPLQSFNEAVATLKK